MCEQLVTQQVRELQSDTGYVIASDLRQALRRAGIDNPDAEIARLQSEGKLVIDAAGKKHAWRSDLFDALKKRQKPDGSWSNTDKSFFENNPELATAYAVLTLSYCRQPGK